MASPTGLKVPRQPQKTFGFCDKITEKVSLSGYNSSKDKNIGGNYYEICM